MYNINVSVVVCTYNATWFKLKSTLESIISQKNIEFEIIIADDCSRYSMIENIKLFFRDNLFKKYKILVQNENIGTVKNYYTALCVAKGDYTFGISPGDMFYDRYVLEKLFAFSQHKNIDVCFGDVVYYQGNDERSEIINNIENSPRRPWYFDEGKSLKVMREQFILGNSIIGASFFRKTQIARKYFGEIVDISKYIEDYTTTTLMLYDGLRIYHFPHFVVWYEYGTGVSTSTNQKWKSTLSEDLVRFYKFLKIRNSDDKFLQNLIEFYQYPNNYLRIIKCLYRSPKLFCKLLFNKYSKVSIGYSNLYNKALLDEYLKKGGRNSAGN